MSETLFTSESVSEGHPDKMCDQISDAILDAYLAQDADARIACETLTKTGIAMLAGEVKVIKGVHIDSEAIVRKVPDNVGRTLIEIYSGDAFLDRLKVTPSHFQGVFHGIADQPDRGCEAGTGPNNRAIVTFTCRCR